MESLVENFAITVVGGVIGGLVASALAARADRVFKPPRSYHESASMRYPKAWTLRIAAHLVLAAWASIVAALVMILLGAAGWISGDLVLVPPVIFIGVAAAYFVLAVPLRCAKCSRRVLFQTTTMPPYAENVRGLNAWGSIVVRVVSQGAFRCMYCGQRYHPWW